MRAGAVFAAALGAAALAAPALGQNGSGGNAFTLPGTEVRRLPTAPNGIDYELYIRRSPACTDDTPCPAVYMLDAEYSFGLASLIAEHLEDRGQLAPLVLVAIAYQDKSDYRLNRTRDYTPIFHDSGGYGPETQVHSGGGLAFLAFIAETVIPYIEAREPVSDAHRGIIGHSYGGLFATYALLNEYRLFDRAVIVSPSYWYAWGWAFEREAETRERRFERDTRVYMAVGAWEEQPERYRMVSDLERMAERLRERADPNLDVEIRVFENETHASIFPAALSTGLRALFPSEE